ncbi:MAG: prepilin-type N-terminal cleavage/methylation domain-containing protein [Candidatus Veblenbacteria bacterium]|nr:prepilin-type N-terminal cleavage/methylation domain-containing protein [Candidatus Veblenbacteria bacterium]MDZ4230033.1 prepilin-type N-terminal cleavage/methylation domain-containing protein [Candidatus Veblenbacteria bacterium]
MTPLATVTRRARGITLIETLVGIAIFVVIAGGLYSTYIQLIKLTKVVRLRVAATAIANQYQEIARNLTYADVGIPGGIPTGVLPASQVASRDGATFTARYTVRNVDDPFDGTIGGNPNDTSPADYKLVMVEVSCMSCDAPGVLAATATHLSPKNLETSTNNGALFIQVIDADGQPVAVADVHVENTTLIPPVSFDETTNNDGLLQLVDVPPALESYRIIASKAGYSTERTYAPNDPLVINPIKLDATVIIQQVTQITFTIDKVSQLNVASITSTCSAIPSLDFHLQGTKLIGMLPDIYKYDQALVTDGNGLLTLNNMEWDAYNPTLTDADYDLLGTIPLLPLNLAPDTTQDLRFVVQPSNPHSFLVIVRDIGTQLPLSGASVHLTKPSYDETLLTNRGYFRQTSWKDGPGQDDFVNSEMYFSDDSNIDINKPVGEVKLKKTGNTHAPSGELISSTFDAGTATNFATIEWQPGDQPPESGATPIRFQIATNNDNTTWNFQGPDGTDSTYYMVTGETISAAHNGDRYLRYKLFLSTEDDGHTPNLADVAITFVSSCIPPGQAFFTGLTSATYDLEVSLTGYEISTTSADLSPAWTSATIDLIPIP